MKKLLIIIGLLLISFFTGSRVTAQSPYPTSTPNLTDRQVQRQEQHDDRRTTLCERVTAKVADRYQRYLEARNRHTTMHQGVVSRIQSLITKLNAKGCNTTKVAGDLTQFESLIKGVASAFDVFMGKLQDVKGVCSDKTAHRSAVTASLQDLLALRQARQAVQNFYQGTLKPDLKALKQTCRQLNASPHPSPLSSTQPQELPGGE